MAVCDDAEVNVDWQFNVNAQEGDIKNESPLFALALFLEPAIARYQPGTGMICDSDIDGVLMEQLVYGQRHNPSAQRSYLDCFAQSSSRWNFFERVTRSAGGRSSDYRTAAVHVNWQRGANPGTIANAHAHWAAATAVPETDARLYYKITAMYHLMVGQRHNADAMQLYRACFRDDANRLFTLV